MYTLFELVKINNIQKIKEIESNNLVLSEDILEHLIKKNNIEILKILLDKNAELPFYLRDKIITELILRSRIDFIDILFFKDKKNKILLNIEDLATRAALLGKITLFKHLISKYNIDITYKENVFFVNAYKNKKEKIYLYLWEFPEMKKSLKEFNEDIYNEFIKLECKEKITNF